MPAQRNLRRSRRVNLQIGRKTRPSRSSRSFPMSSQARELLKRSQTHFPHGWLSGRVADHPHKRSEPSALLRPGRTPSSIALFARGAQPRAAVRCQHGRAIRPFVAHFAVDAAALRAQGRSPPRRQVNWMLVSIAFGLGQERPFVTYSGSKVYNPWVARGHVALQSATWEGCRPSPR